MRVHKAEGLAATAGVECGVCLQHAACRSRQERSVRVRVRVRVCILFIYLDKFYLIFWCARADLGLTSKWKLLDMIEMSIFFFDGVCKDKGRVAGPRAEQTHTHTHCQEPANTTLKEVKRNV